MRMLCTKKETMFLLNIHLSLEIAIMQVVAYHKTEKTFFWELLKYNLYITLPVLMILKCDTGTKGFNEGSLQT